MNHVSFCKVKDFIHSPSLDYSLLSEVLSIIQCSPLFSLRRIYHMLQIQLSKSNSAANRRILIIILKALIDAVPICFFKRDDFNNLIFRNKDYDISICMEQTLKRIEKLKESIGSLFTNDENYQSSDMDFRFIHTNYDLLFAFSKNDFDKNEKYQEFIKNEFKKLITNIAPMSGFNFFLKSKNGKKCLTRAVIEIITDLHKDNNATQEQILFIFSVLSSYIINFTMTNDIDLQQLADYIMSRPFVSPFCLYCLINHTYIRSHFFDLFIPVEFTKNMDEEKEIAFSQYELVDLSIDSKFDEFLKTIPKIISNYFSSKHTISDKKYNFWDDNDFLCYLNLSPLDTRAKMKVMINLSKARKIGPEIVAGINLLLLKTIIRAIQAVVIDSEETNIVNSNFCYSLKNIYFKLSIGNNEQISKKLFSLEIKKPSVADMIIRLTLSNLIPLLTNEVQDKNFIKFCIKFSDVPETSKNVDLLILKIFQFYKLHEILIDPDLSEEEQESLFNSFNFFIVIQFVNQIQEDFFTFFSFEEYQKNNDLLKRFANKFNFYITKSKTMYIEKQKDDNNGENIYNEMVCRAIEVKTIEDAYKLLRSTDDFYQLMHIIYGFAYSQLIESFDFASQILEILIKYSNYSEPSDSQISVFETTLSFYALPIAQTILMKFIELNFTDLADKLFAAIFKQIEHDNSALHWISHFLTKYYNKITDKISELIHNLLTSLPMSNKFYFSGDNFAIKIAEVLNEKEYSLNKDPKMIEMEYSSEYMLAFNYAICSFSLSSKNPSQVAQYLLEPLNNIKRRWSNRNKTVQAFSRIALSLNNSIGYEFFKNLLNLNSNFVIKTGGYFLLFCRLKLYMKIYNEIDELLEGDEKKTIRFLKMFFLSYKRIYEDKLKDISMDGEIPLRSSSEIIYNILSLGIKNHNNDDDLKTLFDIVCYIYSEMKLNEYRKEMIELCISNNLDEYYQRLLLRTFEFIDDNIK